MTNLEKLNNYLDECKIFYVTTVDGDKPKCRPFSFKMIRDNKMWFGVGTFKDCYKQLEKNPNIEIVASNGQGFIRYYGKATFVDDDNLFKEACKEAPYIPQMYNETNGNKLGMFYLSDAIVEIRGLKGIEESFKM